MDLYIRTRSGRPGVRRRALRPRWRTCSPQLRRGGTGQRSRPPSWSRGGETAGRHVRTAARKGAWIWNRSRGPLQKWVDESRRIVFFGGAGVSTESGIPTSAAWTGCITRSMTIPGGDPQPQLFDARPEEFYRFTGRRCSAWTPSPTRPTGSWRSWRRRGKLTSVVTQNIDGLHQRAGSPAVWELHGKRPPQPLHEVRQGPIPWSSCGTAEVCPDVPGGHRQARCGAL